MMAPQLRTTWADDGTTYYTSSEEHAEFLERGFRVNPQRTVELFTALLTRGEVQVRQHGTTGTVRLA